MNLDELFAVLARINHERDVPVDETLLQATIALVMKNPLDEDRGRCQDQIAELIITKVGANSSAH